MRPREEQELYRGAFTAWVTERAPWSPDEARMFKVKGQQLTVEDLLAELDEDTARVPRSPAAVRQVLGLDEGATWTDAAQAARARLPKGGEDGPVATTQYPSAETIAQLALQAQQAQWDYVNSLDNKASGLLALDGLILTLLFTSGVTRSQWNLMLSIGAAALGAATLLLLAALAARGLERNPNVIALLAFMTHPADETNEVVAHSITDAIGHNQNILRWKVRWVRRGLFLSAPGIAVAAAGLLYSVIG